MKVTAILMPYDSGHDRKRMGLGPDRIFEAGLKPLLTRCGIPFESEQIELESDFPAEISAAFQLSRKVADCVRKSREGGSFPIVLSGNCNAAVGTVSGCGADKTGIVWFDAHGEASTPETTRSGFLDGMPISTLLGRAWQALAKTVPGFAAVPGERIVLFGSRAVEPAESSLLDDAGVQRMATVEALITALPSLTNTVDQVYLHVDLDVLDPSAATANQWAPPNGITVQTLLDAILETGKKTVVAALGVASYDPGVDRDGRALTVAAQVIETVLKK